jgi:hypothetical protein
MKRFYAFILHYFLVFSFVPAQNTSWLWTKGIGSSNADEARLVTTDNYGNIYVAGTFFNSSLSIGGNTMTNNGSSDFYLVKYDPNGVVQWARSAGGLNAESVTAINVNLDGEISIAGNYYSNSMTIGSMTIFNSNANGTADIFLAKYDVTGNVIWVKNAGGSGEDIVKGISTDRDGNIFMTGHFYSHVINFGSGTITNAISDSADVFLAKFDPNGNTQWVLNAGGNNNINAGAIAIDLNSNAIICGSFKSHTLSVGSQTLTNSGSDSSDVFIVKCDNNGNVLWAKNAGGNNNDAASSVAIDNDNNIYLTGNYTSSTVNFGSLSMSNAGISNMFLVKYDANGNEKWSVNSEGEYVQNGNSVCTDKNGYIYVSGGFHADNVAFGTAIATNRNPGNFSSDNFIVKYNDNGIVQWLQSSGGMDDDESYAICADTKGNIIISGTFLSANMIAGNDTLINTGISDAFVSKICNVSAKINSSGATTICDGDILILTADAGDSYTWNTGSNARSIQALSTGDYQVQVNNANGCSLTSTNMNVMVNNKPAVTYTEVITDVNTNANTFMLTPGDPSGGIYSGSGVSGNIFDPSIVSIGNHEVVYTYIDANGCSNSDTSMINVFIDSIVSTTSDKNMFTVFPVQVTDFTTIKFNTNVGAAKIFVFNSAGEKVMETKTTGQPVTLDFRRQPSTAYFIFVHTSDRIQTRKIIKP